MGLVVLDRLQQLSDVSSGHMRLERVYFFGEAIFFFFFSRCFLLRGASDARNQQPQRFALLRFVVLCCTLLSICCADAAAGTRHLERECAEGFPHVQQRRCDVLAYLLQVEPG